MKIFGLAVTIIGIVGAMVSGTADYLGLNITQQNPNEVAFGWLQLTFIIFGGIIAIIGITIFVLDIRKKTEEINRLEE